MLDSSLSLPAQIQSIITYFQNNPEFNLFLTIYHGHHPDPSHHHVSPACCVPPALFNLIARHFALVHSVPATLASMVLDFPRHAPTSGPLPWCLLHGPLFPRKPRSYSPLLLVHDSEIIFSVSLPWQPKSNLPIPPYFILSFTTLFSLIGFYYYLYIDLFHCLSLPVACGFMREQIFICFVHLHILGQYLAYGKSHFNDLLMHHKPS